MEGVISGLPATRQPHRLYPQNLEAHRVDSIDVSVASANLRRDTLQLTETEKIVRQRISLWSRPWIPAMTAKPGGDGFLCFVELSNRTRSVAQGSATPRQRPERAVVGGWPDRTEASSTEFKFGAEITVKEAAHVVR